MFGSMTRLVQDGVGNNERTNLAAKRPSTELDSQLECLHALVELIVATS